MSQWLSSHLKTVTAVIAGVILFYNLWIIERVNYLSARETETVAVELWKFIQHDFADAYDQVFRDDSILHDWYQRRIYDNPQYLAEVNWEALEEETRTDMLNSKYGPELEEVDYRLHRSRTNRARLRFKVESFARIKGVGSAVYYPQNDSIGYFKGFSPKRPEYELGIKMLRDVYDYYEFDRDGYYKGDTVLYGPNREKYRIQWYSHQEPYVDGELSANSDWYDDMAHHFYQKIVYHEVIYAVCLSDSHIGDEITAPYASWYIFGMLALTLIGLAYLCLVVLDYKHLLAERGEKLFQRRNI